MAYALASDLASYMHTTLDSGAANLALQLVSDEMDKQLGRDPEQFGVGSVTDGEGNTYTGAVLSQTLTDILVDGPAQGSSLLLLPVFPVTAVAEVQTQDVLGTWTALTYQLDYLWSRAGVLTRIRNRLGGAPVESFWPGPPLGEISVLPLTPIWPSIPQGVMASVTAGFTAVPASLRSVNLTAAARVYANPTGLVGETVGGYSVRYSPRADGGVGGVDFNALELLTLNAFMDRVVG